MSIISNAKEIADLVRAVGNTELYRKVVDLEREIIELQGENLELTKLNRELERRISARSHMDFRRPFYYSAEEPDPYCPKCWEVETLQVHLIGPTITDTGDHFRCPNCSTSFITNRRDAPVRSPPDSFW